VLGGNRTVGGVLVIPDNVSLVVDAEGLSIEGPGKIENGIGAVAVDETLVLAPANPIRLVKPDDVSLVVDVKGIGDETAGGIDCRVYAAAIDEGVLVWPAPGSVDSILS
jgi:hypothetical protein